MWPEYLINTFSENHRAWKGGGVLLYDKTDNLTSFHYISCKVVCMQTTHSDTALYALTQEIKFTQHILFIFASDFVRSYAYLYQEDKPCPRGVYTGISPASSDHISACRYSNNLLFSFWNFEFVWRHQAILQDWRRLDAEFCYSLLPPGGWFTRWQFSSLQNL